MFDVLPCNYGCGSEHDDLFLKAPIGCSTEVR